MEVSATKTADLVLEGGGVRGIALAGAVVRLAEAGYRFQRVAGSSAGAITGALVAAMQARGGSLTQFGDIVRTIDYRKFRDRGPISRWFSLVPPVADGISLLLHSGVFEGDYLHDWLTRTLAGYGVRTFGDLRLPPDPGSDLPDSHRYGLVVMVSDISRQRGVRLPWDYADYGLDPDEQPVADAVRMSASLPFYFEPTTLGGTNGGTSTIVDGGLFSNYPITIFDRTDGRPPRWPTFGVRLSARPEAQPVSRPVKGAISLALAIAESLIGAWDAMNVGDPCALARSVFVDTMGVSAIDFDLTDEQQEQLFRAGGEAAAEFLAEWDFAHYVSTCRGSPQ